MKLLPNILVAVDFHNSSDIAINMSIALASEFCSRVTLIYVMKSENLSIDTIELLEQTVTEKLSVLKNQFIAKNINVDTVIETGVPFEKIINTSLEKGINVIVTGSGNKTVNEPFKLGTTTEKLIRKSPIPVWVVKEEEFHGIKKIICPVDFSDASKRALNNAITFARRFNTELLIINVFTPFRTTFTWVNETFEENENSINLSAQKKEFEEFLGLFDFKDTNHVIEQIAGDPADEILRTMISYQPDLLIMGTTGKSELSRMFMGSVTAKVTRELLCSFITTKEKGITDDYLDDYLSVKESVVTPAKTLLAQGNIEASIEKYTLGLKQYPDCIPILIGLIKAFQKSGDDRNAELYIEYANKVINRIWGEEYLNIIKLP